MDGGRDTGERVGHDVSMDARRGAWRSRRGPALVALAAILATACTPGTGSQVGRPKPSPVASAATPVVAPTTPTTAASVGTIAGLIGNNGGSLISVNSGKLVGRVTAPASVASGLIGDAGSELIGDAGSELLHDGGSGLIGDHGSELIGDAGSELIGDAGSERRLLTVVEQVALANVHVRVFDAGGRPLVGADGKQLQTVTDAQGAYTLDLAGHTEHNLVVSVLGPHQTLSAIAPIKPDHAIDLDLVSTLATRYILSQYVRTQADPVKTLDRLPADVEATTRARAADALAKGSVPAPDALTTKKVDAAVEALRKADATFDGQLETVRKLLIVAGQSDLGNGQDATSVDLGRVLGLLEVPGQGTLVNSAYGSQLARIWRLAGTKLVALAGGDQGTTGGAHDAGEGETNGAVAVGPDGRLLLADGGAGLPTLSPVAWLVHRAPTLAWLAPDGTRTPIAGVPATTLFATVDGQDALVLTSDGDMVRLGAGAPATTFHFADADAALVRNARAFARDAAGRLYLQSSPSRFGAQLIYRCPAGGGVFAPLGGVPTPDPTSLTAGLVGLSGGHGDAVLDHAGNVFLHDPAAHTLSVRPADDGPVRQVLAQDFTPEAASLAADGTVTLAAAGQVYRIVGGKPTVVAGLAGQPDASAPLALAKPAGLALGPDGALYVGDAGRGAVLRYAPTADGYGPATQAVANASGAGFATVQVDAHGAVLMAGPDGMDAWDAQGHPTRFGLPAPSPAPSRTELPLEAFALAADGTGYAFGSQRELVSRPDSLPEPVLHRRLLRLTAGSAPTVLADDLGSMSCLALDRQGAPCWVEQAIATDLLHPATAPQLVRWSATGKQVIAPMPAAGEGPLVAMAIDAAGRFYFAQGAARQAMDLGSLMPGFSPAPKPSTPAPVGNRVLRLDPATPATMTPIAGAGGLVFTGNTVDDGLANPAGLAFTAKGDMLVLDADNHQVKVITADHLK